MFVEIKMKRLVEKLNTPLAESFINAELKRLNDFEAKAEILLYEGIIDIYKDYSYSEYAKEIEYLRIKADYYRTHAFPNVHAVGNTTVVLYTEHIYLKEYLLDKLKTLPPSQHTGIKTDKPENEPEEENNILQSTIEDWIFVFKENMSTPDYNILVGALLQYFEKGTFPKIDKEIRINGRVNKKLFGWSLNRIYRSLADGNLPKEYLVFAKDNISLFSDVEYNDEDFFNCNLYKYFTTKTK